MDIDHSWQKMKVNCKFCNKNFVRNSLREHVRRVHQDESLRTCHLCEKVLKSRAFLYTHYLKDHTKENNPVEIDNINVFKCHYCEQIFSTSVATYTHMKLKHNVRKSLNEVKASSTPKCSFCNETFKSEIDFIDHLVKDHPEKEAPFETLNSFLKGYKCSCGDFYQSPFSYYRHLKYNHEKIRGKDKLLEKTKFSKCKLCIKTFKELKNLKIHMMKKHHIYT